MRLAHQLSVASRAVRRDNGSVSDESFEAAGDHGQHLTIDGEPTTAHIDRAYLADHRFADGLGLPLSYRRFVEQAGWGRLFGLWLVYPPVLDGFADGLQGRAARLTKNFQTAYASGREDGFDWIVEPDGSWDLVGGLAVFAMSENGDHLLWDTGHRDADGEFPVFLSVRFGSLTRLGASFDAVLPRLRADAGEFATAAPADVVPLDAVEL